MTLRIIENKILKTIIYLGVAYWIKLYDVIRSPLIFKIAKPIKAILNIHTSVFFFFFFFFFFFCLFSLSKQCWHKSDTIESSVWSGVTLFAAQFVHASSRKHTYIILTPLKPYFYPVKLGFTGVYIIFLISA